MKEKELQSLFKTITLITTTGIFLIIGLLISKLIRGVNIDLNSYYLILAGGLGTGLGIGFGVQLKLKKQCEKILPFWLGLSLTFTAINIIYLIAIIAEWIIRVNNYEDYRAGIIATIMSSALIVFLTFHFINEGLKHLFKNIPDKENP